MAMDGLGDPKDVMLGWPGDLYARDDEGAIRNVKDYFQRLNQYNYLDLSTIEKICAHPSFRPFDGKDLHAFDPVVHCPFKIFKVTGKDGPTAIFVTTRNFTYGEKPLQTSGGAYQREGFTVIHKMGDGTHFKSLPAEAPQSFGLLPGRSGFDDRPTELADDYLSFR